MGERRRGIKIKKVYGELMVKEKKKEKRILR